jgi:Nicotinate phosphoribosyltransferase (NAPRTase) family
VLSPKATSSVVGRNAVGPLVDAPTALSYNLSSSLLTPDRLKWLDRCQGDGIDIYMLRKILDAVLEARYSAESVAFGMGGGLLQRLNRDTMSFATKLSHIVYADGSARVCHAVGTSCDDVCPSVRPSVDLPRPCVEAHPLAERARRHGSMLLFCSRQGVYRAPWLFAIVLWPTGCVQGAKDGFVQVFTSGDAGGQARGRRAHGLPSRQRRGGTKGKHATGRL